MLLRAGVALLVVLLSPFGFDAHADIRYRVRPSYGELDSFGRGFGPYQKGRFDCDVTTQQKLWGALAKQPVITVRQNGVIDITFSFDQNKGQLRATRQFLGPKGERIGYWESEVPGLSFRASILERRAQAPLIQIGMSINVTHPDGSVTACTEQWSGSGDKF